MNDQLTAQQLRDKTPQALQALLHELHKERFTLRMKQPTGEVKTHRFKQIRRMIARVKTCLTQLEIHNEN